jgi:ribonuclease P protein component
MKIVFATALRHAPRSGAAQHDTPALFVGTLVSTKLEKSAVKRNRMRRRCREAFRITIKEMSQLPMANCQLLLAPRASSLNCDFEELREDTENFLKHLGVRTKDHSG